MPTRAAERIVLGNLGAAEVEGADAFVLICPQNIVGHSVIPLLEGAPRGPKLLLGGGRAHSCRHPLGLP